MSREISFRVSDSEAIFFDNLKFKMHKQSWKDMFLELSRGYVKNFNKMNAEQIFNLLISDEYKEEFKQLIDKILKDEAQRTITDGVERK